VIPRAEIFIVGNITPIPSVPLSAAQPAERSKCKQSHLNGTIHQQLEIMTDRQSNLLDMYGVVNTLYTANQAVIDLVAARANAFTAFQSNVTAINAHIGNQSQVVTGVSADKTQARIALNGLTHVIFALARTWALAVNDLTNAGEFDFSLSEIAKIKDDSIVPFVEHRLTIVNNNLSALSDYGVTVVLVTQWQDAISDYSSVVSAPRSAIVSRSTSTTNLRLLFDATQRLLRLTIDPLMLPFKTDDPELYAKYRSARIIIDRRGPYRTKAVVEGTVINAVTLLPEEGVTVSIVYASGQKDTFTDSEGRYSLVVLGLEEPTPATLTVSAPHPITEERQTVLIPSDTVTEDFTLQPVPPAP
jgi:hypothetical protein